MIGFMCGHCRQPVNNSSFGTVGKFLKKDGEEVLVHRCKRCGAIRKNRVAGDDDDGLVRGLEVLKTL